MLENLMITQNSLYLFSGFLVLFFGTLANFAFMGLLDKHSQKVSNIFTVLVLAFSGLLTFIAFLGFKTPHSLATITLMHGNIGFGAFEAVLCTLSQLCVLLAFLISQKHLRKLRFKQHYFNTLYLGSALTLNILFVSKGFLPFILSLETLSLCTFFIILGFKERKIFYTTFKYLTLALSSTALIIFSYAMCQIFNDKNSVIITVFSALFILALLFKSGIILAFERQGQGESKYNFPSFVFLNTVIFFAYCAIFSKIYDGMIFITGAAQIFTAMLVLFATPFIALKIKRALTYSNLVFTINSINFCTIAGAFLMGTKSLEHSALVMLLSSVIAISALLCVFSIYDYNKSNSYKLDDFRGLYYKNPQLCMLLSVALFINIGILPSGIMTSRYHFFNSLAQTGLWSIIALIFITISYVILICTVADFVNTLYKKPIKTNGKTEVFKKRMNLNYSILFICIILSIILIFI